MLRGARNTFRLLIIGITLLRYNVFFGKKRGKKLARALEKLGPSFIKLGQAISTRSDLIGEDVAEDLARLRDKLPPFPTARARAIIEEEFGKPVGEIFLQFDDESTAAASIAQVHRAVLKDGKSVAVKVLRPGIEKAFARDIELFFWLAGLMEEWLPRTRRLKPRAIVETLRDTTFLELDLRFEAAACDELATNIAKHDEGMHVPKVLWNLTSRRVLTSDWVDGISLNDMEAVRASGIPLDSILRKAANSIFAQIFIDGFFHADMHPGNVFLDTKTGNLIAVDFGIMGRLDWQSRAYIAGIIHGFLREDYRAVAELHFSAGYVPPHKNIDAFTQACRAVAKPIMDKPLNEISVAALLGQMFKIAAEFEMEVQPQLLLMQKSLMVAEGLGRMLDPKLNMWELARPLIEQWAQEHFSPTARIKMAAIEAKKIVEKLPTVLRDFERAVKVLGEEQGIKLHPDTIRALALSRRAWHRKWLLFAWVVFASGILLVTLDIVRL